MTQSINLEPVKQCLRCVLVLLLSGLPMSAQVVSSGSGADQKDWKTLEEAARQSLNRASECAHHDTKKPKCSQKEFLDEAASRYQEMARMLPSAEQSPQKIADVGNGLLRSGHAAEAIDFLRQHDIKADGNLLHLMADSLFAIGDYKNAGLAYKDWISAGCTGYLFSLDDAGVWAMRLNADRCASLPEELRARLEHLREIAGGEPANLPKQGEPAIRATSR